MTAPIVLVGGFAAAQAATELRTSGHRGPVVLIGAEEHLPYERPPLSKGYLLGTAALDSAYVQPAQWYADNDVALRLGTRVTALDPARHVVVTEADEQPYAQLVLATGARPRRLDLADESGAEVAYLRTIDDSDRIRAAPHAWPRRGDRGRRLDRARGGGGRGRGGRPGDRSRGSGAAAGARPRTRGRNPVGDDPPRSRRRRTHRCLRGRDLARRRDPRRRLGHRGRPGGRRRRRGAPGPSSPPLRGSPPTTGSSSTPRCGRRRPTCSLSVTSPTRSTRCCTGGSGWSTGTRLCVRPAPSPTRSSASRSSYGELPYFFSDQYDVGLEYVGSPGPEGYDDVVIREGEGDRFVAWWLRDGVVVAGMHLDEWDAIDEIRSTVGTRLR